MWAVAGTVGAVCVMIIAVVVTLCLITIFIAATARSIRGSHGETQLSGNVTVPDDAVGTGQRYAVGAKAPEITKPKS